MLALQIMAGILGLDLYALLRLRHQGIKIRAFIPGLIYGQYFVHSAKTGWNEGKNS